MDIILFLQSYPLYTLIVISVIITFLSTLVTKWLTDQEHLKHLKKRQKEIQDELKKCVGNECKMKELQNEMLEITGKMMKSSFKPMLVTFIPFLLLFYFLRSVYNPVLGTGWIWWYIGTSIVASIALRKILKVA